LEKQLVYALTLIVLSLVLLIYSVLGFQGFIAVVLNELAAFPTNLIVLIPLVSIMMYVGLKRTSILLRIIGKHGSVNIGKTFILKPMIESLSEEEIKNAMLELSSFIRFLHGKNILFELSFVSIGFKKPFVVKLSIHNSDANVHDFVRTNFKMFCRKWSIIDKEQFFTNKTLSLIENPFF